MKTQDILFAAVGFAAGYAIFGNKNGSMGGNNTWRDFKNKSDYVRARYLLRKLKDVPDAAYFYFNGSEGMEYAVYQDNFETTYEEAIETFADKENTSVEDIEKDYKNWYYIMPKHEVVESIEWSKNYYSPNRKR